MKANSKLNSVQVLRAIACLAVVAHHSFRATTVFVPPPDNALFVPSDFVVQLGAAGVDIFFVISGFLMTYISGAHFSGRQSSTDFIIRRIIRIWPPYAIATLAACLLLAIHHDFSQGLPFNFQPHRLASIFFIPSYDQRDLLQPIIGPGWTLNYEMMFYACFALTIALGQRLAFVKLAAIITMLFVTGRMVPEGVIRDFFGQPIIFEFLFGAAIGFALTTKRLTLGSPWIWMLLSFGTFIILHYFGFGGKQRLLAFGIPAAFLFMDFLALEDIVKWPRLAILIGNASYSIYLIHILVIYKFTGRVSYLNEHGFSQISTIAASMSAIIAAVACGLIFYWAVERPVYKWLQRSYSRYISGVRQREALISTVTES